MAVGWARGGHVAEGDHQPSVRGALDDVPVARECCGQLFWFAPGACLVVADGIQGMVLPRVLTHEHQQLLAIGGPDDAWLRPLAGNHQDDALRAPGETAIEGFTLPHHGVRILGVLGIAPVGPHHETLARVKGQDALGGYLPYEARSRHGRPRFSSVLGKGPSDVARKIAPSKNEKPFNACWIGESVEDGGCGFDLPPVGRRGQGGAPGEAAVFAAGEWAEVARMVDAPSGKHGFAVGQQGGVTVALISGFGTAGDDGLSVGISGNVDRWESDGTLRAWCGPLKGGRFCGQGQRQAGEGGDGKGAEERAQGHGGVVTSRRWFLSGRTAFLRVMITRWPLPPRPRSKTSPVPPGCPR